MNPTEKIVLKQLSQTLHNSTATKWNTGYLDDWTAHARKMHHAIDASVSVIDGLLSLPTEEPKVVTPVPNPDLESLKIRMVDIFTYLLDTHSNLPTHVFETLGEIKDELIKLTENGKTN